MIAVMGITSWQVRKEEFTRGCVKIKISLGLISKQVKLEG
jgi:DNA polymerase III psi subunit